MLTDLCRHGNLEDFMAAEGAPLSVAVKLDLMLQVASGLEALKEARVLWRDLKAKNLLVSDVERGRAGEVTKLFVKFTDWGTAVKMPRVDEGESRRRMTLHGPGTAGYIAPDTRGPMYDYQADMWAYLVWAASMCLTVPCVVDCQLEEALALLKLEKKANATAGHEAKVEAVLGLFEAERKVEPECEALFELIKTAAPWVDSTLRWTPEEAFEELTQFRADHALATKPGTKDRARNKTVIETKHKSREEVAEKKNTRVEEEEEEEAPAVVVRGETNVASSPRGTEIAETEIAESNDAAGFKTSPSVPTVPTTALALVDEGAAKRRAAAAELRARAERLKREAERLEAEAEAVAGEEDEQGSPLSCFLPPSELAQRAARTEAALASARWVGAKVRKWFPVPRAAEPITRREKSKKSMLRVKRNEPQNGAFREGVIIKTRAAFVGTVPNVSEGSEKNVPEAHDWAVVCLVRFEDGEEDELTLKEAEKCVKDRDERDLATDFRISESPVDENAETEPVGSLFVRAMATNTNRDEHDLGENDETTLRMSSREPRLARGAKRAREAEETTEVSRRTRQRGRPPLGALSSNQVASRDVRSKVSASAPKGALPSKLADLNETQTTPDSGSGENGSGSGKRRGRKAPDWAVTAVEVMGFTLGCAKCRQSRYGCGLCRERAGICDPENPPVLMLPSVETETEEAAPSSKTERQRRRTVSRDVMSASAAKPAPLSSTLSKTKKKRKKDSQEEAFVNVGDISDVTTRAELKKRLPRGVKLGCSKCRQAWRGCNACRKQNGVWIAPASNWVARGASQSPPGAALALPAC